MPGPLFPPSPDDLIGVGFPDAHARIPEPPRDAIHAFDGGPFLYDSPRSDVRWPARDFRSKSTVHPDSFPGNGVVLVGPPVVVAPSFSVGNRVAWSFPGGTSGTGELIGSVMEMPGAGRIWIVLLDAPLADAPYAGWRGLALPEGCLARVP